MVSENTCLFQPEKTFDLREMAVALGVCYDTLWRHARQGKLPAFRVGRSWRVHGQVANVWVESNSNQHRRRQVA